MPRPCKLTFDRDFESGVRVTCDVGYLYANFSLPKLLCSPLTPDVRDRQTSDAPHRLILPLWGRKHNKLMVAIKVRRTDLTYWLGLGT